MDIEKLAVDANDDMKNEIHSILSKDNKLTPGNVNTKGFLLDESDVLLFQKELNSKEENDTSNLNDLQTLLRKRSDKQQNPLSENSSNFIVPEQRLAEEDKSLKSNLGKTNDTSYEIKSMPIEISVDQAKIVDVESAKTSTIDNVVRTHSEIISQQIKDQIIDRILVSANDLEMNKTVKIVFNPSLLENTEVNFQKIGQGLSIQFETLNANSLQFLKANQIDLQLYLQENLKQFQDVSVRVKGSSQNFEQPQDGRSRNRYEYENLDDDEQ